MIVHYRIVQLQRKDFATLTATVKLIQQPYTVSNLRLAHQKLESKAAEGKIVLTKEEIR
jgi:hypothetical protein